MLFKRGRSGLLQIPQTLWIMIFDAAAADLAATQRKTVHQHGAPAVLRSSGVDLLAQYQYLGLGHLYAFVNGLYTKEPEYADMGRDLQLFWEA